MSRHLQIRICGYLFFLGFLITLWYIIRITVGFDRKTLEFLKKPLRYFDYSLSSQGSDNPRNLCAEKKNTFLELSWPSYAGKANKMLWDRAAVWASKTRVSVRSHIISTLWAARLEGLESYNRVFFPRTDSVDGRTRGKTRTYKRRGLFKKFGIFL